jgi:hypothetical protein
MTSSLVISQEGAMFGGIDRIMTLTRLYVWNQKVILPDVVQTEDGFFADEAPIQIFEVKDIPSWKNSLETKLLAGNKIVPTPDCSEAPGSAILEALNIHKWSTFEQQAVMYTIHGGSRYITLYRTGKGSNGMWTNEGTEQRRFDPRAPIQYIVDGLVSDVMRQKESRPPATGLMVLPKENVATSTT